MSHIISGIFKTPEQKFWTTNKSVAAGQFFLPLSPLFFCPLPLPSLNVSESLIREKSTSMLGFNSLCCIWFGPWYHGKHHWSGFSFNSQTKMKMLYVQALSVPEGLCLYIVGIWHFAWLCFLVFGLKYKVKWKKLWSWKFLPAAKLGCTGASDMHIFSLI